MSHTVYVGHCFPNPFLRFHSHAPHYLSVVDGNVIRVFARLHAVPGDPASLLKPCWSLAEGLMDHEQPGAYNQVPTLVLSTAHVLLMRACTRGTPNRPTRVPRVRVHAAFTRRILTVTARLADS